MNQQELQEQYESVQRNIRLQFEEIEQISSLDSDNKDQIIEKLALQNQYIYNQYNKLYEKSLTIDDIAHLIDISSRDEFEIKQYVQDQVKSAFEEKLLLEKQVGSLNMELYKLKEKCLQKDHLNDINVYKQQIDDIISAYSDFRSSNNLTYHKEINVMNLKSVLMTDLELLTNLIYKFRENNNQAISENDIHLVHSQDQTKKLIRNENTKSYEKLVKQSFSKKSSAIFNDNSTDKSVNIRALLRANKIEIENELRMKIQKIHSPKKKVDESLDNDDNDEIENDKCNHLNNERQKKEENGLKTIIKHSIQRLNAIVDEIYSQNVEDQPLIDSLRDELIDLTTRIYTMKQFSADEETQKWSSIVKNVNLNYEEKINSLHKESENKTQDIIKLREFLKEYQNQVDNMKKFIEDIERDVKDKENLLTEMNSRISSMQLQLEDEQNYFQEQSEEKNNQVIKLTSQLQQITHQKNELFIQNTSFKDEVTKIEEQLNQMIISKREFEEGLDNEKEVAYIEYNKLRIEFETQFQKYSHQSQDYENQIQLLRKQIQLKEIEMDEMQSTFNELEQFSKRQLHVIQDQQEQIIKLKKTKEKNKQYKQMIYSSNDDLQNLKSDFNKFMVSTQSTQKELDFKNEEISKFKEEISFLKMRNEGCENRIEILERRNDELENIALSKEKYSSNDKSYFENKINQLEQEKIELVQENSTLLEQKKQLINKSNVLMESIEQLQDQNEKSVDLNTQLATERDILQDKLFKLTDLIALNRGKLSKQQQDIYQYQQLLSIYKPNQNTQIDLNNELSSNSIFNNQYFQNPPQQQQQQMQQRFQQEDRQDIIIQQEYQPSQLMNACNFEEQQPIQFTQSNSNTKCQKISTFSQPFYNESDNYLVNSNFSNNRSDQQNQQQQQQPHHHQHNHSDNVSKYSFSNPYQNAHNETTQPLLKEENEVMSNQQTKRGQDDNLINNQNLTYSKSNLSYSPFTIQNEQLNSEDTFNNSNMNRIPTDNHLSWNQMQTKNDHRNNIHQNEQNFSQQQQSQANNESSKSFNKQNQFQSNFYHQDMHKNSTSKHKLSLDDDLKKLNSLAQAMGDRKQSNQHK